MDLQRSTGILILVQVWNLIRSGSVFQSNEMSFLKPAVVYKTCIWEWGYKIFPFYFGFN